MLIIPSWNIYPLATIFSCLEYHTTPIFFPLSLVLSVFFDGLYFTFWCIYKFWRTPQLSPLPSSIHTLSLGDIIQSRVFKYHLHADNFQILSPTLSSLLTSRFIWRTLTSPLGCLTGILYSSYPTWTHVLPIKYAVFTFPISVKWYHYSPTCSSQKLRSYLRYISLSHQPHSIYHCLINYIS